MAQEDYYYEIQLTNKQLVFYFLAGATGLILAFLAGLELALWDETPASRLSVWPLGGLAALVGAQFVLESPDFAFEGTDPFARQVQRFIVRARIGLGLRFAGFFAAYHSFSTEPAARPLIPRRRRWNSRSPNPRTRPRSRV